MAHCKYHPLEAATWECKHCTVRYCDRCVGDTDRHGNVLCQLCERTLDSLGTGGIAEPFWRRLEEAFRYPVNGNALPIIIGVAVINSLLIAFPIMWLFTLLIYLALTGALIKYAFRCLERTAAGEMRAPTVGDAYEGGLGLLFQLIGMMILLGITLGLIANYIGPAFAGVIATLFMICLPAMLIHFAHSENMIEALNPLQAIGLIAKIGLPYGLLIAFIMIMMGSVSVINELIGTRWSILSLMLQSIVSNYYTIVVFHIMGYMLYQYQDKLGYSVRADNIEDTRDESARLAAKSDVFLKEGNYEKVVDIFTEGVKKYPNDKKLSYQFFQFSLAVKRKALIKLSANHYLTTLVNNQELDKLNLAYANATQVCANLIPENPEVRLQLAKTFCAKGKPKIAAMLLKGLNKSNPKFPNMSAVFLTMADALQDMDMQAQAEKYRAQGKKLARVNTPKQEKVQPSDPFAAKDIATPFTPEAATENQAAPAEATAEDPKELPPIEFK